MGSRVTAKEMSLKSTIAFTIFTLVIGMFCLFYSYKKTHDYNKKLETFIEVDSRVIDYREKYNDGDYLYAIVVEYIVDGERYQATSNMYSNRPSAIGSIVVIHCNPDDPEDVLFDKRQEGIWIVLLCGVMFSFCGFLMLCSCVKKIRGDEVVPSAYNDNPLEDSNDNYL